MNPKKISDALTDIDPKFVDEASAYKKPSPWLKWGSIAACIGALVITVTLLIPKSGSPTPDPPEQGYKNVTISEADAAIVWPWEYKTNYEKYITITFEAGEYVTRGRSIPEALLGEVIGSCDAEGFDLYTDKTYTETFQVRQITGISRERLVAVVMDEGFYVYLRDDRHKPDTLGQFMDEYNLAHTLKLSRFSPQEGYTEKGHYILDDDGPIWQILSQCREAKLVADDGSWKVSQRNYLSFSITSEALGVYKKAFYVTEDGFIWTNILEHSLIYEIGADAARQITEFATKNAVETAPEPYEHSLAGTLTEIGDGYILLDDSVLCADEKDGQVYRVSTQDLRIRRCLEYGGIKAGDIVVIKYAGAISGAENTVEGAYAMCKGIITDHTALVPE